MGLREGFEAYGGNYQETMERFLGNEGMYLRLLDMMFEDDNLDRLGEALAARDLEAAFTAAHTLKGVVGNMGLTPLYQAVCDLVEPLRQQVNPDTYQGLYQDLRKEFQKVDSLRAVWKGEQ